MEIIKLQLNRCYTKNVSLSVYQIFWSEAYQSKADERFSSGHLLVQSKDNKRVRSGHL